MEENIFGDFPPEVIEDIEGLSWLGHLDETIEFCGHSFTIRTLKADEELIAALLAQEYTDTIAAPKAWAWANIALALVAVDGEENFCPPIGPDKKSHARAKFRWVTERWYWPLAEYLFACYAGLVERQAAAIRAVEDLSSRSLPNFTPFVDSSTDRDSSEEDSTPSNSD